MLGATFIIVIGWVIVLFSKTVTPIYVSRFLFGVSMGIVFTTVPLYIAEVASPRIRGALSTCFQAMLYMGHLIEFCVGPYVAFLTLNIVSLVIACAAFLCLFFIVESPLHYLLKGNREKAHSTVQWLLKTNGGDVDTEISKLQVQLSISESGRYSDLFNQFYGKKLIIVLFAAIAQRFTGMSAVVAYAATTFSSTNGLTSDQYTIIFGLVVFLFTFVSASLIDNLGRRPLILISCIGCAVTHFVTGTYFYEIDKVGHQAQILPFIMILLFSMLYSLGVGPLVNTLQGELFPANIKGLASSLVTVAHAASSFAVTKLFPAIRDSEGIYLNFYIFGASCAISFIISYIIIPETKQEDLDSLQRRDTV